ncbi:hypothetical protein BJI67_03425 [Acidihalobacter aeolianus]|uniref:Uncharacterized protein n=2 Tax=Acidihalobacter aeolianus TaxID=2792603 RepID=A0A1D8K5K9_9GAMM|nr:hypothetical protein BJI67_03425 [Acidihalobacter aeolianus]
MPYSQMPEQTAAALADDGAMPLLFVAAALLAALAGYVNAMMLSYAGLPVSHMSGPAIMLGIDLGHDDLRRLLVLFGIMASFLIGAMAGLMISSTVLRPGRSYGIALLIEGGLLTLAGLSAVGGYSVPALMLAASAACWPSSTGGRGRCSSPSGCAC